MNKKLKPPQKKEEGEIFGRLGEDAGMLVIEYSKDQSERILSALFCLFPMLFSSYLRFV
jgi:hypothetical protein